MCIAKYSRRIFFFPFYAVTKKKEKLYNFSRLNYVVGETDTMMINPDTTQ